MTTHARHDRKLVRTVVLGAALFIGSVASVGQASAGPLIPAVDTGGPGGGGGAALDASWKQTAAQHSIVLIESKEAPGGILAGIPAPLSRIPYEESEHAVAENRVSVAIQAPASPQQVAF